LPEQLNSLQALRGIAALAVVCHHAFRAVTVHRPLAMLAPPPLLLGNPALIEISSAGVDVFFVLSGFIMHHIAASCSGGARPVVGFLAARLLRVWPLYALVNLIACAALLVGVGSDGATPYDLRPLRLASTLFVPSFNERGVLQPIVGVGWTLNYEMLFYVCFAVALAFGRRRIPGLITLLLTALYGIGTLLPPSSVSGAFLGNGIVFEFLFGVWISEWVRRTPLPFPPFLWIAVAVLGFAAAAFLPEGFGWRGATRGIPAAALLIGMLGLEARTRWPGWSVALGDASYSTYLIHTQIVYWIAVPLFPVLHAHLTAVAPEMTAAVAICFSQAGGLLCHRWVEKPLRIADRTWRRSLGRRPAAGA
jgi:peptidoglycan/LPS O-acetylase OafA/YrhL